MRANPINAIEYGELIEKLRRKGYGKFIDCLLNNEESVYTKKGRLNKSSACRELDWKSKQLEDTLNEMRTVLENDLDL